MIAFVSDFILKKYGGINAIKKQVESARTQISTGEISVTAELSESDIAEIQNALQVVELRTLDLMQEWQRNSRSLEGKEFRQLCSFAFDLRRSLPSFGDLDSDLKSYLLLSCTAVLGDRSADIRRHFREIPWMKIPQTQNDKNWGQKVFYKTADAFLRVIRKQDWADIEEVANSIKYLREQQKVLEKAYLESISGNSARQIAALELVAFYHFAKAVEVLGLYVGTGKPTTATDEVEFHITRSVKAAESAGIIELAILLRWLGAAARALVRLTIW